MVDAVMSFFHVSQPNHLLVWSHPQPSPVSSCLSPICAGGLRGNRISKPDVSMMVKADSGDDGDGDREAMGIEKRCC